MINLMTHCGSQRVEADDVYQAPTPEATRTHTPIPHGNMLSAVREVLRVNDLEAKQEAHALSPDRMRYFGMLEIGSRNDPEFSHILGIRNSHDKRFAAGITMGTQVMVCDNLAFSGDITLTRRHVGDAFGVVVDQLLRLVRELPAYMENTEVVYSRYKATPLRSLSKITVEALDAGVITGSMIPKVLKEYREPRHEEFAPRTLWSWFNAVTEVAKGTSLELRSARTQRLHALCDHYVS
jgi:hypothetical protein